MCGKTFCTCKVVYAVPTRGPFLNLSALDGHEEQQCEKGA